MSSKLPNNESINLATGYSGLELVNKNVCLEFYDLYCANFQQNEKLCQVNYLIKKMSMKNFNQKRFFQAD